jgi:hypothetical protein
MEVDEEYVIIRPRGRPVGTTKAELLERRMNQTKKARRAKLEKLSEKAYVQNQCGKGATTRSALDPTKHSVKSLKDIEAPGRQDYVLSEEMNRVAIRILHLMHQDNEENPHTHKYIFETVSRLLDIGTTKLRDLWFEYKFVNGQIIPPSRRGLTRKERMGVLDSTWSGVLRTEIYNMRMSENGHPVEIPDIQRVLKEKHEIEIM